MSEIKDKLLIAIVSASLGGAIGFGSKYFFQSRAGEFAKAEFARKSQHDFLLSIYDERKSAYIDVEAARFKAVYDPTEDNVRDIIDAFSDLPFLRPRLPSNDQILGFREEVSEKLLSLETAQDIKAFLEDDMYKYTCIFDVNLQTIENMIRMVATEDQMTAFDASVQSDDLVRLDNSCLDQRS